MCTVLGSNRREDSGLRLVVNSRTILMACYENNQQTALEVEWGSCLLLGPQAVD